MRANFAIDTNIAFYAFSDDPKNEIALVILEAGPCISVQLLNEFVNVSRRKRKLAWTEIEVSLLAIKSLVATIRPVDIDVHHRGFDIAEKYQLSVYDSMIIAAALLDGCDTLYSEDMQHGLIIDDTLTIIDPFLEAL